MLDEVSAHGSNVAEWYIEVNDTVDHYNKAYLAASNERKRLLGIKALHQRKHP